MEITVNIFEANYNDENETFDSINQKSCKTIEIDESIRISELLDINFKGQDLHSFLLQNNMINSELNYIVYNDRKNIIWDYKDSDYTAHEYFKIFEINDNVINFVNSSERGGHGPIEFFILLSEIYDQITDFANKNPIIYDLIKHAFGVAIMKSKIVKNFLNKLSGRGCTLEKFVSYFKSQDIISLEDLKEQFDFNDEKFLVTILNHFDFYETKNKIYIKKNNQDDDYRNLK